MEMLIWHLWQSKLAEMGIRPDVVFVDVFVEPNPNVPEGAGQRLKSAGASFAITRVHWEGRWCRVTGWSSVADGSPCAASTIPVEDSGSGTALLIYGGDWGLRLMPENGEEPFGEPYLLVDDAATE